MSSPVLFSGNSRFAQDFQQVIDRAVAIASLPLHQLQAQKTALGDKINAAKSLNDQISALGKSLDNLSSSNGANTFSTTVSDDTVLQASASSGALAGSYTVQVIDPGSFSTSLSATGLPTVTDPSSTSISSSSSFTLTVGANTYTIKPTGNNLNALAAAINSSGAAVQATIINVGPPSSPNYRLALQSTNVDAVTMQVNDGSTNLLSTLTTGSQATYTVNGQPAGGSISTDSRTVTVGPGLTVTLEKAGTSTVTVSRSAKAISDAISSFVTSYNNAIAEMDKSRGKNGGALSGDSLLFSVTSSLRQIVAYQGPGNIKSLIDLGVEVTKDGMLSFDASKIESMSAAQIGDVISFLGDSASGGFLKTAADNMNQLIDPTNGIIPDELTTLNQQSTEDDQQIQAEQNRIDLLQTNLESRMAAADALIAQLEQQVNFINALFSATTNNNSNNNR